MGTNPFFDRTQAVLATIAIVGFLVSLAFWAAGCGLGGDDQSCINYSGQVVCCSSSDDGNTFCN